MVVASQKTLPAALALLGLLATSGVYCTRTAFSALFPVPVTDFQGVTSSRAAGPVAAWHIVGRQRRQRCWLLTQSTAASPAQKCGAMLAVHVQLWRIPTENPCHDLSQQHSGGGCAAAGGFIWNLNHIWNHTS